MTYHDLEVAELTPDQRKHYESCLRNGSTPKMALMLATQHAPRMTGSDQAFNEGARRKMNGISPLNRKMFEIARKAGINTEGKYHVSGLGAYTNPLAWVSTVEDVKESLKRQNLNATGLVNHQAVVKDEEPPPPPRLAPDLVDDIVSTRIRSLPSAKVPPPNSRAFSALVGEVREQVIEQHGRPDRKSGRAGTCGSRLLDALTETR